MPKFGHSTYTTLNNKSYKAHKEIGHDLKLSSHPKLDVVKLSGCQAPSPTCYARWCKVFFSPIAIFSHNIGCGIH